MSTNGEVNFVIEIIQLETHIINKILTKQCESAREISTICLPNRPVINRSVQPHKQDRSLAKVEEGLYYLCSEDKGADQLRIYCKADLRLLFSLMQIVGFPMQCLCIYLFFLNSCNKFSIT